MNKTVRTSRAECSEMLILRRVEILTETDSTNAELKRRAADGRLADGELLIAERQTCGRGRRGRSWENTRGALLMSLACDVSETAAADIPLVTFAAALGVIDVLTEFGSLKDKKLNARIKWPNDILIGRRKLCGILAELVTCRERLTAIVGLGMNVNAADVSEGWRQPATSLFIETGETTDVNALGLRIAECVYGRINALKSGGKNSILAEYTERCATLNRNVTIYGTDGSSVDAFAVGIDDYGRLKAVLSDGEIKLVDAGDVSVRSAEK